MSALRQRIKSTRRRFVDVLVMASLVAVLLSVPMIVFATDAHPVPATGSINICDADEEGGARDQSAYCKEQNDRFGSATVRDPLTDSSSPILGPNSITYTIIQWTIIITGALSVVMIVIGGFRYVTSGGDSTGTKGAKDTILYAVIGLVIAIFAQTIVTFVLSKL